MVKITEKDKEILDILTKHFNKEFAICYSDKGKILIEGENFKVSVPSDLNCKLVIHTHLTSILPSNADLKASENLPVCVQFNKMLKCFYKGKEIKI